MAMAVTRRPWERGREIDASHLRTAPLRAAVGPTFHEADASSLGPVLSKRSVELARALSQTLYGCLLDRRTHSFSNKYHPGLLATRLCNQHLYYLREATAFSGRERQELKSWRSCVPARPNHKLEAKEAAHG
jgi:hypothetical protein